jgi:hypothetical protein
MAMVAQAYIGAGKIPKPERLELVVVASLDVEPLPTECLRIGAPAGRRNLIEIRNLSLALSQGLQNTVTALGMERDRGAGAYR